MTPTGIIRRVDDFGRIVIPEAVRKKVGIEAGQPMEISYNEDVGMVRFVKYEPEQSYTAETGDNEDEYIHRQLPTLEILCQLAEEAAELSQAALKLRRALAGTNPAPVSGKAAMDNLIEEVADTLLCENLLLLPEQRRQAKEISQRKKARWVARLKAAEAEKDDRTYEVTEVCPWCEAEVSMVWNTDVDGFKAYCPHCGKKMMLCDECRHVENDPIVCDYCSETDRCRMEDEEDA